MRLSSAELDAIATHRYRGGPPSLLDVWLLPWWRAVTCALPLWLAPNAISLLGTAALAATLPLTRALPSGSLHLCLAAALLVYQTADAVDGMQARRTGSASPLGELLDHGCDALATLIIFWNVGVALALPTTQCAILVMLGACAFLHVHLDAFQTGALRTHVCGIGVTELQCAAMGLHLLASLSPLSASLRESIAHSVALSLFSIARSLQWHTASTCERPLACVLALHMAGASPEAVATAAIYAALLYAHAATEVIVRTMARSERPLNDEGAGFVVVDALCVASLLVLRPAWLLPSLQLLVAAAVLDYATDAVQWSRVIARHLGIPILRIAPRLEA